MYRMQIEISSTRTLARCAYIVVLVPVLLGCTGVRRTYNRTGQPAYVVSCSSVFSDWRGCLVKAGRLCGSKGYAVNSSDEINRFLVVSCTSPQ